MVCKGLGLTRFDQKRNGPKGGLGQKWCAPKVVIVIVLFLGIDLALKPLVFPSGESNSGVWTLHVRVSFLHVIGRQISF